MKLAFSFFAPLSLLLLSNCSTVEREIDNVDVRALQKKSIEGLPKKPIAGRGLLEFFEGKTRYVGFDAGDPDFDPKATTAFNTGRAAAISADGYYLTAAHVVDSGKFYIVDEIQLKPFPKPAPGERAVMWKTADFVRKNAHRGRIVWQDKETDLAIVKFGHRPSSYFRNLSNRSTVGTRVFTAAEDGVLHRLDGKPFDEAVGNGPFATAGAVTEISAKENVVVHDSTLQARGGMSGAPVADENGTLVGILNRQMAYLYWLVRRVDRAQFTMASPDFIQKTIAEDRSRYRGRR